MRQKTKSIALLGLLFGLALILSFLEGLIPPIPVLPPGVKLGLSNLITMYCLLYLGAGQAYLLATLKAGFALITRGAVAGLLSGCGGILSVTIMLLLMKPKRFSISVFLLSVCGAMSHNLGQLIAVSGIIGGGAAFSYLPILLIAGVLMGTVTGLVLRVVLPAVDRLNHVIQT